MADVKIFWDPSGFELDSLGRNALLRTTDGDTPYISLSIRMLSIDAPETHYPGTTRPSKHDADLRQLADWIAAGHAPLSDGLAQHLHDKLATGTAGSLQEEQGKGSKAAFEQLLEQKLTRPDGSKRQLFLYAADTHFDQYGRLLAYIGPYYSNAELATMSRHDRATFNLLLVESGWAASFPIYPALPRHSDLVLLQEAARLALLEGRGIWQHPATLTGYEFRMCIRLFELTRKLVNGESVSSSERSDWVTRYCADMTTREIYYPADYYRVPIYNRIFIWPEDVTAAVATMNLVPGQ